MTVKTPHGAITKEELSPVIRAAINNNFGVALFRLPGEKEVKLIHGPCENKPLTGIQDTAFLIAPFNNNEDVLAIEPAEVFPMDEDESSPLLWHFTEKTDEGLKKDVYKKIVRYGIEQIKAGSFDKVVVTNKKVVDLPENFDLLEYFNKLNKAYPNAFVSLVSTPQYGTWIGATPELLLSFDSNELKTEALAGTLNEDSEQDFSEKEQKEQSLVSSYIEGCFEDLAIDYNKEGPQKVKAGNLNHLKTYFQANQNGDYNQLWSKVLNCLHPTPAVCGYPLQVTKIFVRNEEPFNRELYTGFLGPVYWEGSSNVFVNLRCMQIHGNEGSLFAGAGIVKGSQSEEEWAETEDKMKTLLDIIEE